MKGLAWVLMLFYLIVSVLWIANSPYLFSLGGISVWVISIILGFFVYKQISEPKVIRKLICLSSFFMVFLLIVTGLIYLTVTSMP